MGSLKGIKVNDLLFHENGCRPYTSKVVKVTKLHAINDRGTKYNLRTGFVAGDRDPWCNDWATHYVEERHGPIIRAYKDKREAELIRERIGNRLKQASLEQLRHIEAIVTEAMGKDEANG